MTLPPRLLLLLRSINSSPSHTSSHQLSTHHLASFLSSKLFYKLVDPREDLMASLSMTSAAARAQWTPKQNKLFEQALAVYDRDTPDRWHNIARAVGGGKSAEDVRRYYELLEQDVGHIESGKVPFPAYRCPTGYGAA